MHRNFAQYLADCAPQGWVLRPVWNEWHSGDGLYHADLLHYEIRTPDGVTAYCKGDYTGAITEGWAVDQANLAFYSDITVTAPDGQRLSFPTSCLHDRPEIGLALSDRLLVAERPKPRTRRLRHPVKPIT